MCKLGLEKAEEPELKLPAFVGSWRKQENSRKKKSTSTLLTTLKPLTVGVCVCVCVRVLAHSVGSDSLQPFGL